MKLCFSLSLTPFRTTDPHASDFPLMGGGESMAAVVVLYLLTATQGPRLMSMCKPFQLNLLLIVYNFFMVLLSVYMFTVVRLTGLSVCLLVGEVSAYPGPMGRLTHTHTQAHNTRRLSF